MRVSRRTLLGAAGSAAVAYTIAGCGGGTSTRGRPELEFATFYTGEDGPTMQDIVDRYNQSQDEVTIRFTAPAYGADYVTKIRTAALAGRAPAIVALHNNEIPPLAPYLHEVSPEDLGLRREDFSPVAWDLPRYEGRLLGVTMSTGTQALYYHRDHFEKAGLDPERPPANQADLVAAARALTRDGRYGMARDAEDWLPWYTYHWQAGGELLAADGRTATFDSPAAIDAAQFEQDLITRYRAVHPTHVQSRNLGQVFFSGKVSMLYGGPWHLAPVMKSNQEAGTNIGWAPFPSVFTTRPAIQSTSHIYCLTKQDDRTLELAGKFLSWVLTTGSAMWARSQAPTYKKSLDELSASADPLVRAMTLWIRQGDSARFLPIHPRWSEVSRSLTGAMQRIMFRGAPVAGTLREEVRRANAILGR